MGWHLLLEIAPVLLIHQHQVEVVFDAVLVVHQLVRGSQVVGRQEQPAAVQIIRHIKTAQLQMCTTLQLGIRSRTACSGAENVPDRDTSTPVRQTSKHPGCPLHCITDCARSDNQTSNKANANASCVIPLHRITRCRTVSLSYGVL
jgi:hypothetical protein